MKLHITPQILISRSGFSLVEVTIAAAICTLAVVTLLGFIPQGLEMSRKTSQMTESSYLIEQILRDLEGSTWESLTRNKTSGNSTNTGEGTDKRYYDMQGSPVTKDSKDIVYVATFSVMDAQLPSDSTPQSNLVRVRGRVASTSNADFNFNTAAAGNYVNFYQLIARSR